MSSMRMHMRARFPLLQEPLLRPLLSSLHCSSASNQFLLYQPIRLATPIMAASLSANMLCGSRASSFAAGEDRVELLRLAAAPTPARTIRPRQSAPRMGNVNAGKGIFAPLVVVTRNVVGKKQFNQLRGKAIALHSQVINEFCKTIGADNKQRQGLIRLAKKNGEKLGFLA